jgi:hypothetical protein
MKNIFLKSIQCLLLVIALLTAISAQSYAQNNGNTAKEKIESMRVAFITNKIDLTADEAKSLWPIYNEYQAEMQKLRDTDNADDIGRQEKELEIKKRYNDKFRKIIPNKLAEFYSADKEFKRILIEKMTGGNRP